MKKRKIYLIGIFILIVVNIIVASLFLLQNHGPEVVIKEASYIVSITSNDTTNYTILLPIPKRWDSFFDIVRVAEGNANISKSNISDGPAIQICGNGSVRIESIGKGYVLGSGGDFSWCYQNKTTKVYCEKMPSDADVQVDVYYVNYFYKPDLAVKIEYWIDGALDVGWQLVKMEGEMN